MLIDKKQIKYPALIFEKDDSKMFGLDYKYLVGDMRYLDKRTGNYDGFKNIELIDSNGDVFYVKEVKKASGIKLWYSIRLVGLMIELEPVFSKPKTNISLEDLKFRIMNHIRKYPRKWMPLDTVEGIQDMVNEARSFKQLILIFR